MHGFATLFLAALGGLFVITPYDPPVPEAKTRIEFSGMRPILEGPARRLGNIRIQKNGCKGQTRPRCQKKKKRLSKPWVRSGHRGQDGETRREAKPISLGSWIGDRIPTRELAAAYRCKAGQERWAAPNSECQAHAVGGKQSSGSPFRFQ
ncbi:hypothetical protein BO71DRAFT_211061 [Aspergillus ellipticus CBS 707.79]|uniref:Ig-like domain-containing protein n=1 Tax=Aspergillus ellipticus CBS 707.79 TaxID=1448320 RepID=A0A319E3F0_9EURO|nr:hypothetical protein BO71DRAFT_211061 [Aspergillus ellipticus CBS 707.79]